MIKWGRRGISWCKRQISRCQRRKEAGIVIDAVFPTGSGGTRSRMTPKLWPNGHPKMNSATNIK